MSQKQILSQRMQFSLKILQMNALDLEQLICESALENPLIELEVSRDEYEFPSRPLRERSEWFDGEDRGTFYHYAVRPRRDELPDTLLYDADAGESLCDALLLQLSGLSLDSDTRKRVRYLINCVDESGYLTVPRAQLSMEMGATDAQLSEALDILQRMDPPGVGAANLRECLLLQARRGPEASDLLIKIIESSLDALARNQLLKIAKDMRVSVDEVKGARERLLELNPKPGNGYFANVVTPYIRPDLFVIQSNGGLRVLFSDYGQPRVEISGYYRELAKDSGSEAARYISERLDKAQWLVSCIKQRQKTLLACAQGILARQPLFFELGPGHLAPMTLADLAGDLELHPSTVSRAIRDKYLQCQWGVYKLVDFFSRSVGYEGASDAQGSSQDMAKMRIKCIISEEDSKNPKSDKEIAKILQSEGIPIARRTVAKYREQLGVPAASGRKVF